MISTSCRKVRAVVIQPLLVGVFAVRITNHKIVHMLHQSAVTRLEGVSVQRK